MRRCYCLEGGHIELSSNWDAVLEWADLCLLPYVAVSTSPARVATIVCHYGDPPPTPTGTGTAISIHMGRVGLGYDANGQGRMVVGPDGTVYRINRTEIEVFYRERDEGTLRDPTRLCREVLYNSLGSSWYELHASAVSHAGKAIVFLGPKGAGKSTILCHLLSSKDREPTFDFLSNDRVWIDLGKSPITALGSPMPICIGYGTMASIPELSTQLSLYRDHFHLLLGQMDLKVHEYSAQEFSALFGRSISRHARISAIVALRPGASNLLMPVEDEHTKSKILAQSIRDDVDAYPNWMNIGMNCSQRSAALCGPISVPPPLYIMEFNPHQGAITRCDEAVINLIGSVS